MKQQVKIKVLRESGHGARRKSVEDTILKSFLLYSRN